MKGLAAWRKKYLTDHFYYYRNVEYKGMTLEGNDVVILRMLTK
jgi:hypothetical protein